MKIQPNEDEWIKIKDAIKTALDVWEERFLKTNAELEEYEEIYKSIKMMILTESFMSDEEKKRKGLK